MLRSFLHARRTLTLALATAALAGGCGGPDGRIRVGEPEFVAPAGTQSPHLAVAGDRVLLSWLGPDGGDGHALRVAVRNAEGVWEPAGTVVANDSLFVNWADVPSVVPLPDGTWMAHWLQKTAPGPYAYHVMMATSSDGGASWGPRFRPHTDTSETEHGFVSLVPWNDGALGLWLDGRNTANDQPMTLRFTTIGPSGATAPDQEVDAQVCDCCQTDVARTSRGLVAAYRDRAEGEIRDIVIRRFEQGAWSEARKVADDRWYYPGCPVNGPAIAARGDTVVVVWFTAAAAPRVYAAFSTDAGATFGPRIQVDDGRPAGRVDVAWWGDAALASWIEETVGAGDVRVRRLRIGEAPGRSAVVATTAASRAAGFPRLAVVGEVAIAAWTLPGDDGGVRAATLTLNR